MTKTGISAGDNKGHITTPRQLKAKPSSKKGVSDLFFYIFIAYHKENKVCP